MNWSSPFLPLSRSSYATCWGGTAPGRALYGSVLREPDPDGVLDFYVIVERLEDWASGYLAREANRLLPPNVEYHEISVGGRIIRAKVAILSIAQFRRMTGRATLDTTIWARFCQPVRLVWVRGPEAADAILGCLVRAMAQAGRWAAALGPAEGTADGLAGPVRAYLWRGITGGERAQAVCPA